MFQLMKCFPGSTEKKEEKKEEKKNEVVCSTYTKKECHSGTLEVFKDPVSEITICGGGRMRDITLKQSDLLIDVGIKLDNLIEVSGIEKPERILQFNIAPSIIKIDWSDGGVPNLPKSFWSELIDVLRAEKKRVVISCLGGHGRTGTTLAILANMMGVTKTDPVQFVRTNYCDEAVETKSQVEYIEKITGVKVEETPAKSYSYNNFYSSGHENGMWWKNYSNEKKDKKDEKKETENNDPYYNLEDSWF